MAQAWKPEWLKSAALEALAQLDNAARGSYYRLQQTFEQWYGTTYQDEVFRARLWSHTKRRNEFLQELVLDMQGTAHKAYRTANLDLMTVLLPDRHSGQPSTKNISNIVQRGHRICKMKRKIDGVFCPMVVDTGCEFDYHAQQLTIYQRKVGAAKVNGQEEPASNVQAHHRHHS
ncbi:hypothetical protein E2C01_021130 [Portunus trituberculatus]|uniref:Uncharacterized protein n=1 Tax=Portunus trituberculatus TaxID=210409 RepID=A0A5B7E1W8_PORTR|nr:hypothetical protein [Portunus trituberculatus]